MCVQNQFSSDFSWCQNRELMCVSKICQFSSAFSWCQNSEIVCVCVQNFTGYFYCFLWCIKSESLCVFKVWTFEIPFLCRKGELVCVQNTQTLDYSTRNQTRILGLIFHLFYRFLPFFLTFSCILRIHRSPHHFISQFNV